MSKLSHVPNIVFHDFYLWSCIFFFLSLTGMIKHLVVQFKDTDESYAPSLCFIQHNHLYGSCLSSVWLPSLSHSGVSVWSPVSGSPRAS